MNIDAKTLAACFGVSRRRVEQLARDGVVVRIDRGKYDLVASVQNYMGHVLAGESTANEPDSLVEARRQLLNEQARRERRQNELADGQIVLVAHVEQVWTAAEAALASQLDGVAGRLANDMAGETNPAICREALHDEHRRIRNAYAQAVEKVFQGPQ